MPKVEIQKRILLSAFFAGVIKARFIEENAARAPGEESIDFLNVGSLIRIPGWAIIQFIEGNCSWL